VIGPPGNQEGTTVFGVVTDAEGRFNPMIGATVKVWGVLPVLETRTSYGKTGFLASSSTDIEGRFKLPSLPLGQTYWVTVEAVGWLPLPPMELPTRSPATIELSLGLCGDPRAERCILTGTPPMIDYRSTSD